MTIVADGRCHCPQSMIAMITVADAHFSIGSSLEPPQ